MDTAQKIEDLKSRFELIKNNFNVENEQKELRELEAQSNKPDFWQKDSQKAKSVMKKISSISEDIDKFETLNKDLIEIKEIMNLSKEDSSIAKAINKEIKNLEKNVEEFEIKMFLACKYDENDAILSIHAGQGGTEAMDWVEMLSRMYQKYFSYIRSEEHTSELQSQSNL